MEEKNLVCLIDDTTKLKHKKTHKYQVVSKRKEVNENQILTWYQERADLKKQDIISKYLELAE